MIAQPLTFEGDLIGAVYLRFCVTRYQEEVAAKREANGITSELNALFVSPQGACIGPESTLKLFGMVDFPEDSTMVPHLRDDIDPRLAAAIHNSEPFAATLPIGKKHKPAYVVTQPVVHDLPVPFWSVIAFLPQETMVAEAAGTMSRHLYEMAVVLIIALGFGYLIARITGRSLSENENWYQAILNRVPLPICIMLEDCTWGYTNSTFAGIYAKQRKPLGPGVPIRDTLRPVEAEFCIRSNSPGAPEVVTEDFVQDDGTVHTITSCRLRNAAGQYIGRLLVGVDMTNARVIEETLKSAGEMAQELDANSASILKSSQDLSDSTMEISSAIEEITTTTQEIGSASSYYAEAAGRSHKLAMTTSEISEKNAKEASEAADAMRKVQESGEKINKVIRLIDDIAFQTNLLALNAAVESARAGRHGKGFAVVADEVRRLAQRSARAAGETAAMVEEMTERIGGAASSVEQLVEGLTLISDNADHLTSDSDEVARLADNQTQSVQQVHLSLNQINQNLEAAALGSKQVAEIARVIFEQSSQLRHLTQEKRGKLELRIGLLPLPSLPGDE